MNEIPSFDKLEEIDAALSVAIQKRTINLRKGAVEFYFNLASREDDPVLFRSESMPRREAEALMDELMERKQILECWLQDMGPINRTP